MKKELKLALAMALIAYTAVMFAGRSWFTGPDPLMKKWTETSQIKSTTKIHRISVPMKSPIVTLEKKTVAEKLQLSEEITKDEDKQIIATAEIPPYDGKTDAVAIMDKSTGEADIIAKQQPISFFSFEDKKAIGVRYGISSHNKSESESNMELDAYGRWDVLRIKYVHVGVYGEVTSNGDGRAMLNLEYRW